MKKFDDIYALACKRHGEAELQARFKHYAKISSKAKLTKQSDAYYLSTMTRRIFRAGLKHALVDKRWPAFEEAFFGFDPEKLVLMTDAMLDDRMQNTALIRHWGKMKSIRYNAQFVLDVTQEAGGFGRWLAAWPEDDIVGLWLQLKKRGKQLGGNSGCQFLRMVGKDTWIPTNDVVAALVAQGIVDKAPSSQRDQKAAQAAFNQWQQQSGLPLAHISMALACTVG